MAQERLTLNTISKWYGSGENPAVILDHIHLTVKENEFIVILGKSGAGKSTLLRIIAGLIQPDQGEVLYDGKKFTSTFPRIAMVFQSHALFPWLNVLENVELGLEALGLKAQERRKRALEAIDLIGLDGYESAFPKELSGGMRQRVGFARALVVNPDILLLDEPFSSLDVLTAENMRNDLMELWIERRIPTKSIIMVSHNVAEAVELASRLIIMDHDPGRIAKEIEVPLLYPREETSQLFQEFVDTVYTSLLSTADYSAVQKARKIVGMGYRLPDISIHRLQGLLDVLAEPPYDGKADVFILTESENLSADETLSLFEVFDLLGFAHISKGDIELTNSGKALYRGDLLERKEIFGYHLMRYIPVMKYIYHTLQDAPRKRVPKERFLKDLEAFMSPLDAQKNIAVAINWGRYAELFSYDDKTEMLNLEDPKVGE
jgi:NitT/TauT family transport system ATP-binding protein